MFEKEKQQYAEDSRTHEKPWELWEWQIMGNNTWSALLDNSVMWLQNHKYRRKQSTFMPEYYSGLNWRDAEHLIGKTVEYTNHPDIGLWYVGTLKDVSRNNVIAHFCIISDVEVHFSMYIRTCEKTFKHPTITIGGVELPIPETVAPALGIKCWLVPACDEFVWDGYNYNIENLQAGRVHLTEERAKAWADWWKATVIDKMERN